MPLSREAPEDAQALIREQPERCKDAAPAPDRLAIGTCACRAKLRGEGGKMEEISLFVALGAGLSGTKQVLGLWALKGGEQGRMMPGAAGPVGRGVDRVLPFVTDDCRGLGEVIGKPFACAQHRLCLLHRQRHLERGLSREAMKEAREALFRLRRSRDREEGGHWLGELAAVVAREKPALARHIEAKAEGYLSLLDYPEEVRVHIYSTNSVEGRGAAIGLMRLLRHGPASALRIPLRRRVQRSL
jgi:transposase-like protein